MAEQNRKQPRIKKPLTIQFCLSSQTSRTWDQSSVENISAGGVKFPIHHDLDLKDKVILLRIRVPELAPQVLELEAMVLDVKPRANCKYCDVRAKFINLSETNTRQLLILEKIINSQV